MTSAWPLQQSAIITLSCWGRHAQQHCCHGTEGPRCWTETVWVSRPGSQSAAKKDKRRNDIRFDSCGWYSRELCPISFLWFSILKTGLHNCTPASLKKMSIKFIPFPFESFRFLFLPFIRITSIHLAWALYNWFNQKRFLRSCQH